MCTSTTGSIGESLASKSKEHIKYVSLNNRLYQARPMLVDIISNKTHFYQFIISVNKSGGSCNTIDMDDRMIFLMTGSM